MPITHYFENGGLWTDDTAVHIEGAMATFDDKVGVVATVVQREVSGRNDGQLFADCGFHVGDDQQSGKKKRGDSDVGASQLMSISERVCCFRGCRRAAYGQRGRICLPEVELPLSSCAVVR